ncbi:hypothetical protein SEA_PICARD_54 [Streptomyces phage Picard]|uniref:Uncharacterized protein n=1 Tax=Streptomyces phage Picard TaxID=1920311 RepID=A0A1J0MC45_9CAUD|nr:hypothetical protein HOR45_gp54 [Streptomyces phage Picard]APD18583.1 hypothetical protein SEA_PICARD_54 [Streptomyces phage Picard]
MSNEQTPPNDDQAAEPTVAEYHRADPSEFPTTPDEQQAAVEDMAAGKGWTSGELIRKVRAAKAEPTLAEFRAYLSDAVRAANASQGGALAAHQTGILAAVVGMVDQYVADRRAGRALSTSTPGPVDPLNRSNLRSIARAHRNATDPRRAGTGDLDRLLDDLADEFDPADVGIVRRVSVALADAMPRIAHKAREGGWSPDEIARETNYGASRVTQFIRQEKERRAAPGELRRYTWRIDTLDADSGRDVWNPREFGEDAATPADLAQLAERLLVETGAHDQRARIVMWEGDEGSDAEAVHTAERDAK